MDIDSLKAFVAVCDEGSFTGAGKQLFITQPAISKRLALLEEQLETRLFDRIGRTVNLTAAGRELYPRAQAILRDVRDTERAISNLSGNVSGTLSLATSHHVGLWRLPDILKQYSQQYPGVMLDLHFMDSEVAHEALLQGDLDLGIVTLAPEGRDHLKAIPIWEDRLTFICAADHPLASRSMMTLQDLSSFPTILPDLTTYTGRIVRQLFDRHSLGLNVIMSTNYLETIKMLITVGLGWSVLPMSMADDATCLLNVPEVQISRTLGVIHHHQRTLSNASLVFLALLENHTDLGPGDA
jgi:DNA-binding transcriptional LysR family regulator